MLRKTPSTVCSRFWSDNRDNAKAYAESSACASCTTISPTATSAVLATSRLKPDFTTQYSPLAPKTIGSPWRTLITRSSAPSLRNASNEPSLKIGQSCRISTTEAPRCSAAARSTSDNPLRSESSARPTKVASAPSANDTGLNGWSSDPIGVDLVILPTSDVGEYWPLVRP